MNFKLGILPDIVNFTSEDFKMNFKVGILPEISMYIYLWMNVIEL